MNSRKTKSSCYLTLKLTTEKLEDTFLYALSSNNAWAGYKAHQNPNFFPKLASGQSPQIREFLYPFPTPFP